MTDVATDPGLTEPNIAVMSPQQASAHWDKLRADEAWSAKLLAGDGPARKIFDAVMARKSESEMADQVVAAVTDTTVSAPPPSGAAANDHGVSPADLKVGVRGLLENGLSPGSAVELLKNKPVCTPEDFEFIRREFAVKFLGNREWTQKLLAGDLEARKQLLAMGVIKITSQPSPWGPTPGVR